MADIPAHTKEELLEMYQKECKRAGKKLNYTEIDNNPNLPGVGTFYTHFDGMNDLFRAAGFQPNQSKNTKTYSEEKIKHIICKDCINNKENCNKAPEDCLKKIKEKDPFYLKVLKGNANIPYQVPTHFVN